MSRIQQDLATSCHSQNGLESQDGMASNTLRRALHKGRKPHVCIVGAGFAGLRCADILLQQGIKVTIYEARDRVGGRLFQSKVGDHLVDMGPNWIHGTKDNPIIDLVRETGTVSHDWGERMVTFDSSGEKVPEEDARECQEQFWGIIDKAFKYSNANSAEIPPTESLLDFVKLHARGKFREPFPEAYEPADKHGTGNKHDFLLKWAEQWGAFIGGTVAQQSLKYFWLEECLDGENLFCAGTYAKILEHVSKTAIEGAEIKFDHPVTKITSATDKDGNTSATVETFHGNGSIETFDEVVVTTPLGWLKQRKEAFEPILPDRISQAIDSLGYGNLDKVYITFPTAFWDTPSTKPVSNGHSTSEKPMKMPNTTATASPLPQPVIPHPYPNKPLEGLSSLPGQSENTSPSETTSSKSNHYPGFTNFIAPTYAKLNPNSYTQEAINLAALPSSVAHPTLLFYTSGPTSTYIADILKQHPPDSLSRYGALWNFFKPYVSLLPNYSVMDPECKPSDILATGWQNDEYAGWGSYTNFPVGLEHGDEDVLALREGCPERGLWFAGEHTAPFVALGTVTGAYWSGEYVAKRILVAHGLDAGN